MKELHETNPFKKPFGSLNELIDNITAVLGCPVTIEDANHRLLAYSSHEDGTDSARVGTIISQRVPEKVINRLWKEKVIPRLMQTETALRIPTIEEIGLRDRVAISIRKNQEVLGYIWAVDEQKKLSAEQLSLLKDAAGAATPLLLKLHLQRKRKKENYQDFFWQLLMGHYQSNEEIQQQFYELQITMPAQFAVLVFRFEQEITGKVEEQITYLIATSQKITNHFLIVMENELILIASPHPSQPDEKVFKEFISYFIMEMDNRFSIRGIKGSSGTIYHSFDRAETSYQQALKVLKLKEQFPEDLQKVFHYHQLGIFQYLDAILKEKKTSPYEHPAITKLENYDRLHNTNFLETLEVFVQHDSNAHEAARLLFVHVNTLNYRLKRIREIGDLDLKNAYEKMAVLVDLKIRRLQ
ncbi:PucR family transcriptional regulator [Planococcus salinus]|uniref:PucR family transcriptional regulator n=1 Tax=Planococcus salinus TaxID=1848460 RepID=A0A3M8P6Y0_9BACL|nr:helix-turn-helix domain-containing protein [Planococcus salinus]RNF39030.1 PucR family transcriptional regulator [Planococcus salinus]